MRYGLERERASVYIRRTAERTHHTLSVLTSSTARKSGWTAFACPQRIPSDTKAPGCQQQHATQIALRPGHDATHEGGWWNGNNSTRAVSTIASSSDPSPTQNVNVAPVYAGDLSSHRRHAIISQRNHPTSRHHVHHQTSRHHQTSQGQEWKSLRSVQPYGCVSLCTFSRESWCE